MHVTGPRVSQREQYLGQIDRITASKVLHGSESLCRLLRYLAERAVDHPGVPLKEYQIATEVFGRPSDFDPQSDSTIRVQASRLRLKLAEYYAHEGADDPIVVEVPKGSYLLSFHHRTPDRTPAMPEHELRMGEAQSGNRAWVFATVVLAFLLALSVAALLGMISSRKTAVAGASGQDEPVPAAFRIFWNGFVSGAEEPQVIFSNGAFVGRPETGMRYFDALHDSRDHDVILDHYTGVGEVLAVHELDRVFALLHRSIRIKRGSLFALDDAKNNNLIFVGSPAENLTLRDIPSTHEFVFQRMDSGPRKGDLAIVNVHPQPDEPKYFLGTPSKLPLSEDYAVIGLVPGLNPTRWVLILAGTTTMGTQAAAEYVCRQSSVEELLTRMSVTNTGQLKPFEAVLRVKVTRGVPVESQILVIRKSGG